MPTTLPAARVASPTVAPLTSLLHEVTHHCAALLPMATGCALSLLTTDGRRITSVATNRTGEELSSLCERMPENPCSSAWRDSGVVVAQTLAGSAQWSAWLAHARSLGIQTVLTSALHAGERRIGTVSVFSSDPTAFSSTDAGVFAESAARVAHRIDACQRFLSRPAIAV
ncbi:GAF domain-containing protein [Mycobacterium sp. pW049]|uniref:GAF domain-containing protein n=1 Tax=[Mycobacterium] bulgaricum TaxID=3238985 RepID=UPI00351ACF9F